ncbi:MAG: carboxypeptidase regulatory-like domain-containing protein [Holophagales bacterium]|nr:MAG: carboxypeptidase regulatory-like domain-containing protein [Holophagales bacterium]
MRSNPSLHLFRAVTRTLIGTLALVSLAGSPAGAAISGHVREDLSGNPVGGARVHVRADPASPVAITAADGSFTLAISPAGTVNLTAAVPYDHNAAANWQIGGNTAVNGQTNVEILIPRISSGSAVNYTPPNALQGCSACHFTQFLEWSTSSHGLAARDEWVADVHSGTGTPGGGAGYVYLNTHDPGETGFCATCHAALEDVRTPGQLQLNEVSTEAGIDGVTCLTCHQIDSIDGDVNALHHLGQSTYRFPVGDQFPTELQVWGPLDDVDFDQMRPSHAAFQRDSRFCASCHQYNNPSNGAAGQHTYTEWLASRFAVPGPGYRTCQSCHMEERAEAGPICDAFPVERPASQRHEHKFDGATPERLSAAILLRAAATEQPGMVALHAEVENAGAGHSFPTGVSIRNAMLVVSASLHGVPLVRRSGPTVPWWADDEVPGQQPGDFSGLPGKGFAKIMEGRINGQGPVVRPVLFIDAEGVNEDSTISSGAVDSSDFLFELPDSALPGDVVDVEARLIYRRAFRSLAVVKGWTQTPQGGPIEIEVARQSQQLTLTPQGAGGIVAVPAVGRLGLALLAGLLAASALFALRASRRG